MTSQHHEEPGHERESELPARVWDAIPEPTVDAASIVRRGRRLRTRRRLVLAGGTAASVGLIAVVAWTAAFRPAAVPPAGPGEPETDQQTSQSASPNDSDPTEQPSTDQPGDDGPDHGPGPDDDFTSLVGTAELEDLAAEHGLTAENSRTGQNFLDMRLAAQDGSTISVTVTTASPEETADALNHAIAERDYVPTEIEGAPAYRQDQDTPGTPIHWLLVADAEATELVSVSAAPAGQEADGNEVPEATVALVEETLLPFLVAPDAG